jgi:hypothetical protein
MGSTDADRMLDLGLIGMCWEITRSTAAIFVTSDQPPDYSFQFVHRTGS